MSRHHSTTNNISATPAPTRRQYTPAGGGGVPLVGKGGGSKGGRSQPAWPAKLEEGGYAPHQASHVGWTPGSPARTYVEAARVQTAAQAPAPHQPLGPLPHGHRPACLAPPAPGIPARGH